MRKLSVIVVSLLHFLAFEAIADTVSPQRATEAAAAFFNSGAKTKAPIRPRLVWTGGEAATKSDAGAVAEAPFYAFENPDGGFVVIAGDDAANPILGYSDSGSFPVDGMPANIKAWFDGYGRQIEHIRSRGGRRTAQAKEGWARLEQGHMRKATPVVYLETPEWDQNAPFNNLCPEVSGETYRSVTGCVSTATAEVMYYHKWPAKGHGTLPDYTYGYGTAVFDPRTGQYEYPRYINQTGHELTATYAWSDMKKNYRGSYSSAASSAVARLVYDIGIMVQSSFTYNYGTGAYSEMIGAGLIKYMDYDSSIVILYRDDFSSADWYARLRHNLDGNMPVIYGGSGDNGGHEFVVDGYDTDGNFRINWGWAGQLNGYFAMDAFMANAQEDYRYWQDATFGIRPAAGGNPIPLLDIYDESKTGGLRINGGTVEKGSTFTASVTYIYNMGYFDIEADIAFALADVHGNIREIISDFDTDMLPCDFSEAAYLNRMPCRITLDPLPGDRIVAAYRTANTPWKALKVY